MMLCRNVATGKIRIILHTKSNSLLYLLPAGCLSPLFLLMTCSSAVDSKNPRPNPDSKPTTWMWVCHPTPRARAYCSLAISNLEWDTLREMAIGVVAEMI